MRSKLFTVLSLLIVASMLLGACSTQQTPTAAPQETQAQAGQENEAPEVEEPAEEVTEPSGSESPAGEPSEEAPVEEPSQEPLPEQIGGWLDRIIFTKIPDAGSAIEQLKAGAIDLFAEASEDAESFENVKNSDELGYAMSYGSMNQMLFNPVVCSDESNFNPFSIAGIREAMNWAVDRTYIAEEIMGGLAKPKFTPFTSAFPDYSRYADLFAEVELEYAYDLEKARAAVEEEMTAAGATLVDGKWEYNGKPVTLIGLIRTEDRRREIGNYFANQMEELGFTVERQEKSSAEASPIWIDSEPTDCKWNFYTAGWISQAISRDDGNMFIQYNTGKMQNLPVFNAMQPSPELYEVAEKLFTNNFSSMEERRSLFEQGMELSMKESWWGVWVTDNVAFSPYVKENMQGAYDLASGFASAQLFPFTVRKPGQTGGEMRIAQSGILIEPWNPVSGSNWINDAMIQRLTQDWDLVTNPYTGLTMPKLVERAEFYAQEGLPIMASSDWIDLQFVDEIQVPGDAWADWDAENQRWITVEEKYPEGITSKTKSVVYYTPELWNTTWHDGSKMSMADFIMYMIMNFDIGKPESKIYDPALAPSVETFLTHFKGIKIISTDPLVIETYDDAYLLDAELSLGTWYPVRFVPSSGTLGQFPWHGMTPAILAEENGELAFSAEKSADLEIERTSFISGPSLEIQVKYLDQVLADQYIPYAPTMSAYLTPEEAVARYENLRNWYNERKHLSIGTGPYYIENVYPVEETVTLARYEDYIFDVGQFASFVEPKLATASVEGPVSVVTSEETSFDIYVYFGDEPYPVDEISSVAYMLYDAEKNLVASGEAEVVDDGLYEIVLSSDITSSLASGAARLVVAVTSELVSIPAFAEYEFMVSE